MSAFLGPVHFWLYDKIGRQEELTKAVALYASENGWIADQNDYIKDLPALEGVIDTGNIHGWLQNQIHDAETRYANLICSITDGHSERMDEIQDVAAGFGRSNGCSSAESPADVYRAFEDFFVNGMPCDRVNVVGSEDDSEVSWEMTQDIHAQYWNGDASRYYTIRSSVMNGMLDKTPFILLSPDYAHYTIRKK